MEPASSSSSSLPSVDGGYVNTTTTTTASSRANLLANVDHPGVRSPNARGANVLPAMLRRRRKNVEEVKYGPELNVRDDYGDNAVLTSKFTLWNFFPLVLWAQFTRLSNAFFLVVAILVWIPVISPVQPYGPVAALAFLIGVTMIREAVEDVRRHRDDRQLNNSHAHVLRGGRFDDAFPWQDIRVGDLVKVCEDELLPVDLLVLNSSEPNGTCYVSTTQLDGETNAKAKLAPAAFHHVRDEEGLAALRATVTSEGVNKLLDRYTGTLVLEDGEKVALDNRAMMYRGSKLVNTKWVYGVAIFTGNQTKIMRNNIRGRLKISSMEGTMNLIIQAVFVVLFAIMVSGAFAAGFLAARDWSRWPYLLYSSSPVTAGVINFFTYFILFSGLVPISLYVYLELVKAAHVLLIDWDVDMYYGAGDVRANAKSSLSDDLGMVNFLFSDKTGTLTRNEMVYKAASIEGKRVGEAPPNAAAAQQHWAAMGVAERAFWKMLALCHTVLVEGGGARYNAESPDEAALVAAAAQFGYRLVARETNARGSFVTLEEGPQRERKQYQLLNVLDFTSERKRMSVVVRDCADGAIYVLCKGADSVVRALLGPGQEELAATTAQHLNEYAGEGLRTLMLAMRQLDADAYVAWNRRFNEANTAMEARDERVAQVSLDMERDLRLLGASAVEDKLQEGVPDAIAALAAAGINIWVLTGDRKDTAINIGFASRLLVPEYKLIVVDADSWDETQQQLKDALALYVGVSGGSVSATGEDTPMAPSPSARHQQYALIIEGKTLVHALEPENRLHLLALAMRCRSVLCCRVGPKQKAEVVALVKNTLNAVTLSIGDGANDVPMIKEAHVGVGIAGKEGRQAVMSSDYALGQFAHVATLLLVHGRWAYKRCVMVILWSFYKAIVFAFTNLWYSIYNSVSGQTLYESWTLAMYHVLFTSLPILIYGMLDQDVNRRIALAYPQLYEAGRLKQDLNLPVFMRWALMGLLDSLLCFFATWLAWTEEVIDSTGRTYGLWVFGLICYSGVVFVVNGRLALHVHRWMWPQALSFVLSMVAFYGFTVLLGETSLTSKDASMYQVAEATYSTALYWLVLALIVVLALVTEFVWNVTRRFFCPENVHVAQYIAYEKRMERKKGGDGVGSTTVLDMARAQHGLDPEQPYSPFVSHIPEHGRETLGRAMGRRNPSRFLVGSKAAKKGNYLVFDDDEEGLEGGGNNNDLL